MATLVFGASGFLGSRITDWLEQKDESITLGTNSPDIHKQNCIKNYTNLNDEELENLIRNFKTIYDASGIGASMEEYSFNDYLNKNSIWPSRLARACIKTNTRLIWLSTIHCEKYEKNPNNIYDRYSLSKFIGEETIKAIPNWEQNILIIRLGNITGSPGKLYRGKSNLFAMDIASNLVKNNQATITSNIDSEINITSLNGFLDFINEIKYGQQIFCSSYNYKLSELAICIKNCYEYATKVNSNILFKGQDIDNKKELVFPEIINKDIKELLKYYLSKKYI